MAEGKISGTETLKIRKALGLSQSQWAKRLGIASSVTISRWENGHVSPSMTIHKERIREAAEEAGVTLSCGG